MNAVRHGLTAKTPVLPGEDPQAYKEFCRKLVEDLRPKGAFEQQLAQSLADMQWRLNTCGPLAQEVRDTETDLRLQLAALNRFGMYEHRLRRDFLATLKQLQAIQAERTEREKRDMKEAGRIMKHFRSKQIEYDPAEDGFVFAAAEVDAWLRLRQRIEEADLHLGMEMNQRFFRSREAVAAR